ncbi:hypothetical protein HPB50_023157 [Hyalomma asiaticum]|uniref:Uncharacterized protein n=1 Tax=Hyalomma asiaticum TaxID=266040 RepID=A0ACB7TN22_HYAAI|nr:hypothetical protein HPB50_023157 [Hyalomma asiaticum]
MQIYVDCLTVALRNTGCTTNPFFLTAESNVIRKRMRDKNLTCDLYSDLLVLRDDAESSCLRVRAVKLFFKCGAAFHFHIEGKSLTPGTICELLKTYVDCGNVALKDTNCTSDDTLKAQITFFLSQSMKKHSLHCVNITSYEKMSPFLKGPPRAASDVQRWAMASSEYSNADNNREEENLPPPGCSYRKLVKLFSFCVVNFFSSFAMAKDTIQACMFLGRHGSCVEQARKSTNCSMKVKELEDFVYLTNVVQDKYSSRCEKEDSRADSKQLFLHMDQAEAGVPSLCKKKSLLQKYLKCSFTLQNKLSAKIDECRALDSFSQCFMEARADNECTYTDDTFTSIMQMQAELMIDNLRSRCTQKFADLNVLLKCAQPDALKKMLLCGLSYNKLMEDLKRQGEYYVTSTTCSYLAEYQHCMIDVERITGCTKSTLHEHTSAILNFWTWNVAPLCESAASLLLTDVDPRCDYPKSLLKALKCTMEFQEFAEQATWDTMTSAESCSSLEMLDKCLIRSLGVGQCRHSLNAKAQVSVLRSLLMAEYKVTCRKRYQSAPGMAEMQTDDYVYEDYYYFGDEAVRTKQPEKNADRFLEDQLSNNTRIAPSARLKLQGHFERMYNKLHGFGLDETFNKVGQDQKPAIWQITTTPTADMNKTNSSEEQQPPSLMTGVVIPVSDNDDALCNMAGYEKEKQRCSQYISDQARKYKRNIKYVPVSNLRDVAENVCKNGHDDIKQHEEEDKDHRAPRVERAIRTRERPGRNGLAGEQLMQAARYHPGCDFRAYEKTRNDCEEMFSNVDVVTSGNNTCSNVQVYITCVKDAMRKTLCSANDTIKESENARIMINVRKKNVTCIPKAAPQNMRQTMSCQRSIALKKFFACSSTFHYYMKNKDDLLPVGGGTDCRYSVCRRESDLFNVVRLRCGKLGRSGYRGH